MDTRSPYDFFQLRMAAFPVERILQLNELLDHQDKPGNDGKIKALFSHPWFIEAIYLASGDLYELLLAWLDGQLTDHKKVEKLSRSLHKYYSRMCSRSTPYGLFAGCTTGTFTSGATDIRFASQRTSRYSRLDMGYLMVLLDQLERDPQIRSQLTYFPNTSIYKVKDKYRYFERKTEQHRRPYSLTAVNVSEYTSLILRVSTGGITIRQMADALLEHGSSRLTEQRVLSFINGLIDMQFLVSELTPVVTGEDFAERLFRRLGALQGTEQVCSLLGLILSQLRDDSGGCYQADRTARQLANPGNQETIQTDLCFNMASVRINETVIREIRNTGARLQQISKLFRIDPLAEFKKRFSDQYEYREIPLVQALDTDTGIGYSLATNGNVEPLPLLNRLVMPQQVKKPEFVFDEFVQMVYEKMKHHLKSGVAEVRITDDDIDRLLKDHPDPVPEAESSFSLGNLVASSQEELDRGNYRFFARHINAPYASKILARFSCADPQLRSYLTAIMKAEEECNPDVIFAEIVHIPEDTRLTNIVMRPRLRAYEMPFLCQSATDAEFSIPASDLLIKIRDGRIVLRSQRLDKEVQPRLTNSHNYVGGLPLYKFLCDLQFDGIRQGFKWEWKFLAGEPFLPRVTYRKFIISKAKWNLKQLSPAESNPEEHIDRLRAIYKIPRYVVIAADDNELLIDLDSPFCRKHLLAELKKKSVILTEFLALPGQCPVKDEAGSYAAEIVIPAGAVIPGAVIPDSPSRSYEPVAQPVIKRVFLPGSEWLYIKLYASNRTLEHILGDVIYPFAADLMENHVIEKWFFIRYNDPESHLRIRFYNASAGKDWIALILGRLETLLAPWMEEGLLVRQTLDTYQREIERYGASTMELCEQLFYTDSRAVAALASMIEGAEGEDIRWKAGFCDVHALIADFGLDLQERCEFTQRMYKSYHQEFNNVPGEKQLILSRSLNDKYRTVSPVLTPLLENVSLSDELSLVANLFRDRSVANEAIVGRLKAVIAAGTGSGKLPLELLSSLIHMSVNRLFLTRQRVHELVLYHHLNKYYCSFAIRAKQNRAYEGKVQILPAT